MFIIIDDNGDLHKTKELTPELVQDAEDHYIIIINTITMQYLHGMIGWKKIPVYEEED